MRRKGWQLLSVPLSLLCAGTPCIFAQTAPRSATRPWIPPPKQEISGEAKSRRGNRYMTDSTMVYTLAELINRAEAQNPATRFAWERARAQAAA